MKPAGPQPEPSQNPAGTHYQGFKSKLVRFETSWILAETLSEWSEIK